MKSPLVKVVFVISALGAWTTHESLWIHVGFGHFEKTMHATNVLLGSSVILLFSLNHNQKNKDEPG
jgi:hypothetical protein